MVNGSRALRALLGGPDIVLAPGCFDAFSAVVAQEAGFPAVYMSGGLSATSLCGMGDIGVRTLSELALQARHICRVVSVPVIADGDSGYGGPVNTFRLIRELEDAGVAGLHLEDQDLPRRCGHLAGKRLVSAAEHVLRIRAAVDARRNPDFVIIARTDAVAVTGLDDAIARAQQYVEAGADVAFIEALESREQMKRAIGEVKAPHLANMVEGGKTPNLPVAELAELGFKLVIYPWSGFGAAFKAMRNVWAELRRTGTTAGLSSHMEPLRAWADLLQTDQLLRDYERYVLPDAR
jgi:carboxyvinyl-carboxyphosphonate phosphorylmutase